MDQATRRLPEAPPVGDGAVAAEMRRLGMGPIGKQTKMTMANWVVFVKLRIFDQAFSGGGPVNLRVATPPR